MANKETSHPLILLLLSLLTFFVWPSHFGYPGMPDGTSPKCYFQLISHTHPLKAHRKHLERGGITWWMDKPSSRQGRFLLLVEAHSNSRRPPYWCGGWAARHRPIVHGGVQLNSCQKPVRSTDKTSFPSRKSFQRENVIHPHMSLWQHLGL